MNAGEFISKMAAMAGMNAQDPALVDLLSSSDFANYKISDDVATKITSSLMTMDAARNNEKLRDHFYAEYHDNLDKNLNNLIEKYQFDTEVVEAVKSESKTRDKYNRLIDKMNELQNKKANAVSKSTKVEVEQEIQTLNNQIKDLQTKLQNAPAERDQFWSERLKTKAIQSMLSGYQYAGEKDIPKDVLIETAQILLNKKLNENKIRIEYNSDQDIVSLKTESGLDFYKYNSPVSFKSFTDAVLSESKMLQIPGASAPQQSAAQPKLPTSQTIIGGGKSVDASKFYAAFDDVVNGK
jgi:RNase H-fold protein (predicted Holliday junction resolvase)